jgi:outer membrane protein assembly factor BamD
MNKRPPEDVEKSYSIFERLVERYPASEYSADAELRMIYLKNRLAAYENIVADYYIRSGAYVAAANRAKTSLEKYNGVPGNRQSIEIMIVAYEKLGMFDLAEDARRVLAENYSDPMVLIDYDEVKKPNFWGKIKALVPKKSNDTE